MPAGRVSLRDTGRRIPAGDDGTLADGRDYTVVSVRPLDTEPVLRIWPEVSRPDGKTLVRVVHMAPELGSPDLVLDGKRVIRAFPFGRKTPYVTVGAGSHVLGAQRPNSSSTLISAEVDLRKGTASSAYVIGGGGRAVQAVLTSDARTVRAETQAAATKRRGTAVHVVRPGESLWRIAEKLLGSAASDRQIANEVKRIWDLNSVKVPSGDPRRDPAVRRGDEAGVPQPIDVLVAGRPVVVEREQAVPALALVDQQLGDVERLRIDARSAPRDPQQRQRCPDVDQLQVLELQRDFALVLARSRPVHRRARVCDGVSRVGCFAAGCACPSAEASD